MSEKTLTETLAAIGCSHRKERDDQRRTIYRRDGSRVGSFTAHEAWLAIETNQPAFSAEVVNAVD